MQLASRLGKLVAAGPALTPLELVAILAFWMNWLIAPVSVACVLLALLVRRSHRPLWLAPVALLNLCLVLPQLAVGSLEPWLLALLSAQAACAVAALSWALRSRRVRPSAPGRASEAAGADKNPFYPDPR